MEIEEIPSRIGIKRSIIILVTLTFFAGMATGYVLGFQVVSIQVDTNLQKVANQSLHNPHALIHSGEHYYTIREVQNKELYEVYINDSIKRIT